MDAAAVINFTPATLPNYILAAVYCWPAIESCSNQHRDELAAESTSR